MTSHFPRVETDEELRRELTRLSQQVALLAQTSTVSTETEPAVRIVRGRIAADGTISEGSGFTITKGAAGLYTINFTPAFADIPSTLVMPIAAATRLVVESSAVPATTSSVVVRLFDTTPANQDTAFNFIAIGPAG